MTGPRQPLLQSAASPPGSGAAPPPVFHLAGCRFEPAEGRLWRGDRPLPARAKTLGVLQCLVERPGRLVTTDELLDAVWPDVNISEVAVKVCISELRSLLGDSARTPRLIETVHRRGYRFIGAADRLAPAPAGAGRPAVAPTPTPFVGRRVEWQTLERCLDDALAGQRRIVFVSGEPGIGKTALLERFGAGLEGRADLWIARGQCVEPYGAGEPFLPVLEGLQRLGRGVASGRLVALLRRHAPSWLLQLPALLRDAERRAVERRYAGVGRERMLRELVVGLEAITGEVALVLAIDDLHWADPSTLELLDALARRREPARLLVLAACRAPDPSDRDHRLRALLEELVPRSATELALGRFDAAAIADYLSARGLAETSAGVIHRHTGGHPLLVCTAADGLLGIDEPNGAARAADAVPRALQAAIAKQIGRLGVDDRRVLEAASVCGGRFAAPAVAAALGEPTTAVSARCDGLASRHRFIRTIEAQEWPDGTTAAQWEFAHVLYRDALYGQLDPVRAARLHQRIAARLETAYAADVEENAAELAMHCERGGQLAAAARHRCAAGRRAVRRFAYAEAIAHLNHALTLIEALPPSAERDVLELHARITLGEPLLNTKGFTAPDVQAAFSRARSLCERLGDAPALVPILEGLHSFYFIRGDMRTARALANRMRRLAGRARQPDLHREAHHTLGYVDHKQGHPGRARAHFERAIALRERCDPRHALEFSGHDPHVCCLAGLATTHWILGQPDGALRGARQAVAAARRGGQPFSEAIARGALTIVHVWRGEVGHALAAAERLQAFCADHGFAYYAALALLFHGWSAAAAGQVDAGLDELHNAVAILDAIGVSDGRAEYLVMLADACCRVGRSREGLEALAAARASVRRSRMDWLWPELWRLEGELLLLAAERQRSTRTRAAARFRRALETARAQGARAFALRAATSLAHLWHQDGRSAPARRLLAPVLARFDEGRATGDLRTARQLLRALEQAAGG